MLGESLSGYRQGNDCWVLPSGRFLFSSFCAVLFAGFFLVGDMAGDDMRDWRVVAPAIPTSMQMSSVKTSAPKRFGYECRLSNLICVEGRVIYIYIYLSLSLSLQPNPLVRSSLCSQLQLQLLHLRHSRCETLLWFSWFFLWGLPIENSARLFFLWTMNFPIAAVSLLFHFFFFFFFCYVKYGNALSFSFFNGNFADSLCGLGFCFAL